MKLLTGKVARILFALPFGIFGVLHFVGASKMAMMVPPYVPGGVLWVYLTGLALIAACIAFIIEQQVYTAGLCLAALLVVFVLTVHVPGLMGPMMEMSMMAMLKDVALIGGCLMMAGTDGCCGPKNG